MFRAAALSAADPRVFYDELAQQLTGLLAAERDWVANAANMAALIFTALPDLNWAGFYFLKGDELVLGPFQGRPACVRIAVGQGVCGTAVAERRAIRVDDVHAFAGHIACDPASAFPELVVPLDPGVALSSECWIWTVLCRRDSAPRIKRGWKGLPRSSSASATSNNYWAPRTYKWW